MVRVIDQGELDEVVGRLLTEASHGVKGKKVLDVSALQSFGVEVEDLEAITSALESMGEQYASDNLPAKILQGLLDANAIVANRSPVELTERVSFEELQTVRKDYAALQTERERLANDLYANFSVVDLSPKRKRQLRRALTDLVNADSLTSTDANIFYTLTTNVADSLGFKRTEEGTAKRNLIIGGTCYYGGGALVVAGAGVTLIGGIYKAGVSGMSAGVDFVIPWAITTGAILVVSAWGALSLGFKEHARKSRSPGEPHPWFVSKIKKAINYRASLRNPESLFAYWGTYVDHLSELCGDKLTFDSAKITSAEKFDGQANFVRDFLGYCRSFVGGQRDNYMHLLELDSKIRTYEQTHPRLLT